MVLLLGCAAIVAAAAAGEPPAVAPATPPPGPHLEIEATEVDLGRVIIGKDVEATFVLRNTGTEVLKILSAKPG